MAPGRRVLAATVLASSLAFLDATVVPVALPVIQDELGMDAVGAQWVFEAYLLPLAALMLLGGALGDRLGRRRVLIGGTVAFAVTSGVAGAAPTGVSLILARALQGLSAALVVPNSLALLGATFPDERRGRAIGTWTAATSIAVALGPAAGGLITESVSWRAVFYLNLPVGAAVAWLLRGVEEPAPHAGGRPDALGAVFATVGLGGLVYGLLHAGSEGVTALPLVALVGGALLLASFVLVERRATSPMVPPRLFRDPVFSGVNGMTVLLYGALTGLSVQVPLLLVHVHGYTPAQAGLAFLPLTALLAGLSRFTGGLADRYGARVPLVAGPLLVAAGCLLLVRAAPAAAFWTGYMPALSVTGLGLALTVPVLTSTVLGAVPARHVGVASGVNNAAARVGGLLAVALLAFVALTVFEASVGPRLDDADLTAEERAALEAQSGRFATRDVPDTVGEEARAEVAAALEGAAVVAFRAVFAVCAGLCALSALTARLTVR